MIMLANCDKETIDMGCAAFEGAMQDLHSCGFFSGESESYCLIRNARVVLRYFTILYPTLPCSTLFYHILLFTVHCAKAYSPHSTIAVNHSESRWIRVNL